MTIENVNVIDMGIKSRDGLICWFWDTSKDYEVNNCLRLSVLNEVLEDVDNAIRYGFAYDTYTWDFKYFQHFDKTDRMYEIWGLDYPDTFGWNIHIEDGNITVLKMECEKKEEKLYKIVRYRVKQTRYLDSYYVMPMDADEMDYEYRACESARDYASESDWEDEDYDLEDWEVDYEDLTADEARDESTVNDVEDFECD